MVVNGSRQHSDTYTNTTSPVASQLQLGLFLAVSAFRKYNTTDTITHEDEHEHKQTYIHPGPTMDIMVKTDCDLAGQQETRQTTTSLMV